MDDNEFSAMLDDSWISLSVDGTGYVDSCKGVSFFLKVEILCYAPIDARRIVS